MLQRVLLSIPFRSIEGIVVIPAFDRVDERGSSTETVVRGGRERRVSYSDESDGETDLVEELGRFEKVAGGVEAMESGRELRVSGIDVGCPNEGEFEMG